MPEHLRASVRRRHEQTLERATAALARLSAAGRPITFAAVARERHVSTDFLYRQPVLRLKIQQLRTTNRRMPEDLPAPTASPSAPVLALSSQLKDPKRRHHREVTELKNALAVAHGENLALRGRLAFFEPI
jgi:hypothetical protein